MQSIILSSFGMAVLVLAILGVYGVLAYSVSLPTSEFGNSVPLGSIVTSLVATRAIRSLLYESQSADPASIIARVGILLVVAFIASFLPT